MRTITTALVLLAACSSNAKEEFLADVDATRSDTSAEVTAATTGDGSAPEDSTSPTTTATTTSPADVIVDSTTEVVDSVTPTELPSGSDATIDENALEGFGWVIRLNGLPIGQPTVFDTSGGDKAVAVPTKNGSAAELRTWNDDGSPRWSSTVYIGTTPSLAGVAFCNALLTVTGGESGDRKAFVARLDASAGSLARVALSADDEDPNDRRKLSAPRCGGPGVYAVLNGRQLIDLSGTLGQGTPLPTVSSDKIDIVLAKTATDLDEKVFYLGQVNAPKQLGDTTLAVGDQLIYARDYENDVGGTATGTGFLGNNDVITIAPADDGRFAVVWRADVDVDEQRVTAFDAEGKQIGTAIVSLAAPIMDAQWVGQDLVIAGEFQGAPPFPSAGAFADGVWIAVLTPNATMTVKRSTTFMGEWGSMGLTKVEQFGTCDGTAWSLMTKQSDGVAVVALGDDGTPCHSAVLSDDDSDADLVGATYTLSLGDGDYVFATKDWLRLARLRVGYGGLVP